MITKKHDLIVMLRDNYESYPPDEKEKSLIYRYLREEKDAEAAEKTQTKAMYQSFSKKLSNPYVKIKSAYIALVDKKFIGKKDYLKVYNSIIETYKNVLTPMKSFKDIDAAEKDIERQLLISVIIYDFFKKEGFRKALIRSDFDTAEYTPTENEHEYYYHRGKKTNKNGDIEMMHWCMMHSGQNKEISESSAAASLDIDACERLYEHLRTTKKNDYFIPLYIGSTSGAGVYIIGNSLIDFAEDEDDDGDDIPVSGNCSPCFVYFADINYDLQKNEWEKKLAECRERQIVLSGIKENCRKRIKEKGGTDSFGDKPRSSGITASIFGGVHYRNPSMILPGSGGSDPEKELEAALKEEKKLNYETERLVRLLLNYDSVSQILHIKRAGSVNEAFGLFRDSDASFSGYCYINDSDKKLPDDMDERFGKFFHDPMPASKRFPGRSEAEQRGMKKESKNESRKIAISNAAAERLKGTKEKNK